MLAGQFLTFLPGYQLFYLVTNSISRVQVDVDAEGGPRTGCRCCIYNSHADLCHQAQIDANRPLFERIDLVERRTGRT